MQQLSGLDATFLYLETPEMPMHVGALHVLELPPGFQGRFAVALRRHLQSRLPVAPALRRRLWWMPLNLANPAWVDAEPDLREHVVEVKLPAAGRYGDGMAALEAEVSRLHAVLLDRSRPLWKFHVFEGLAPSSNGRKRVGLYSQLHHAAVDGQAAVALANAIMDLTPVPREIEDRGEGRKPTFELEMTQVLRGVLGSQVQKVAEIVRRLPSTVGTLKDAASVAIGNSGLLGGGQGSGNLSLAPRMPINASVTAGRAYATASLSMSEVKSMARAFDATVNDIVLMLCSSALRRFYAKRRLLPRKSLVAAVPISLRAKGDARSDNQASMSLISLGTHVADPKKRLAHIKAATAAMKSTMGSLKSILPTDFPSLGLPWLIEAATALWGKAKVSDRIPLVANLVISNVPGPPVTLYMAGAKMLSNHPTSIVVHGMGLNITVQSYDQNLDFGLMADAQAMGDVKELAEAIDIAMDDLRALPRPGEADTDEPLPPGPVSRAAQQAAGRVRKGLEDAVGDAVAGAGELAGGAAGRVTGAVSGIARRVGRRVLGSTVDAAVARVKRAAAPAPAPAPARGRSAPAAAKPRAAPPKKRTRAG